MLALYRSRGRFLTASGSDWVANSIGGLFEQGIGREEVTE
jgi:hypothetical protein